jgi:hypothetical protein
MAGFSPGLAPLTASENPTWSSPAGRPDEILAVWGLMNAREALPFKRLGMVAWDGV